MIWALFCIQLVEMPNVNPSSWGAATNRLVCRRAAPRACRMRAARL